MKISKSQKPQMISYEEFQEKVRNLRTSGDATSFLKELIAPTLQSMLEAEMAVHLGYDKHDNAGKLSGNSRNGYSSKTIKNDFGEQRISIPRDRNSEFEPIAVKKHESTQSDVEEKIIAMYGKGLSTRDINGYMYDIYGINVSSDMVSAITDKVVPDIKAWQSRPLDDVYPILYLDGVHFKVRDGGKIISKCAYIILGINTSGIKEIIGVWIGENEGSKFWMGVLNDLKHRGVKDILIACIDGLKGFPEAIRTIFPETEIQECIIHQIRNTTKFIPYKHKKSFCKDLKTIYTAITEEVALEALEEVKSKWPQYAIYLKSWEDKWGTLSTFFAYPEQIRRIIYTTNTIESLNRQFRKVTKTTSIFPHNDALKKLLYLAQKDITKKWTMPIRDWGEIAAQLGEFFKGRMGI